MVYVSREERIKLRRGFNEQILKDREAGLSYKNLARKYRMTSSTAKRTVLLLEAQRKTRGGAVVAR
jgi:Mor family transcriptional regulator